MLDSDYEIIVVDDGGIDSTSAMMLNWSQRSDHFIYLQLSRNFGKEAALMAGFQVSTGAAVICMDADLQHSPSSTSAMYMRRKNGVDMVYAVRLNRKNESFIKRLGTKAFYKMMKDSNEIRILQTQAISA